MGNRLEVVRAGALTTVQDLGRPGYAHQAVPRSGALDPRAMRLANRLVGNAEDAAVLETTVDGTTIRTAEACHVAVTGAPAMVRVSGREAGWGVPVAVPAGATVEIGPALRGVRSYVAVSGGLTPEPVLRSRSTDLLSGLGPAVLRAGAMLPVGGVPGRPAPIDFAPYALPPAELDLPCDLGPRADYLTPAAVALLGTATFTVTAQSNRIGLRLDGPPLSWRSDDQLLSEGVVLGSIQVPPAGRPVLFLADHPVTGGYPVVGVVPAPAVWECAQAAPGTLIRFRPRGRISDTDPACW